MGDRPWPSDWPEHVFAERQQDLPIASSFPTSPKWRQASFSAEELFEIVTWAQLGFHRRNTGLLNVAGYFDPLVRLIDHAIQEGFIQRSHRDLVVVEERPEKLLQRLAEHRLPTVRRWLGPNDT